MSLVAELTNGFNSIDSAYAARPDIYPVGPEHIRRLGAALLYNQKAGLTEEEQAKVLEASRILSVKAVEETKLWKKIYERYPCTRNQ